MNDLSREFENVIFIIAEMDEKVLRNLSCQTTNKSCRLMTIFIAQQPYFIFYTFYTLQIIHHRTTSKIKINR
ncbi:hypothetical protein A7K50_02430 [Dehalobacter sp. MCB1]|nr:hypothetical protein A7K50_02430 [Dehalobacter sp. MCB1]TCX48663.1 hypothetical protein C1I36_11270 [Dehalobacter sp. 14DCB1]TCX56289.1 hypothetical protein C1I38_01920 [Dehalobacter sp. 12DCB1]